MMADIDVVPKHGTRVWVWILLAIVVVAVLFWALAGRTHAAAELRSLPLEVTALAVSLV